MADRPMNEDWWIASDGKWYPPHLGSGQEYPDRSERDVDTTAISASFTRALSISLAVASAVLLAAAYAGIRYASQLQTYIGDIPASDAALESIEGVWLVWSTAALVLMAITGVLVIGWTRSASRALDGRGPISRTWHGGWTIGAWFIPFANLVLPRLVFNEMERIAQVPYREAPIGREWRRYQRSQLGDLWWMLWIAGTVPSQIMQILLTSNSGGAGRMAVAVSVNSITYVMLAGAGIALAALVRRIERMSNL